MYKKVNKWEALDKRFFNSLAKCYRKHGCISLHLLAETQRRSFIKRTFQEKINHEYIDNRD